MSGSDYDSLSELYDHAQDWNPSDDVPFFVDAAIASGGPALELACGTGRVLIPIARAGVPIVGLDISRRMLLRLQARVDTESPSVPRPPLLAADMRQFCLLRRFPLIIVPFRSFTLLTTPEEQESCLAGIREHLTPGGLLLLTMYDVNRLLLRAQNSALQGSLQAFELPDGRRVTGSYRLQEHRPERQQLHIGFRYVLKDSSGKEAVIVHESRHRYLLPQQAVSLLEASGFEVEEVYGNYQKKPLSEAGNRDIILRARRR